MATATSVSGSPARVRFTSATWPLTTTTNTVSLLYVPGAGARRAVREYGPELERLADEEHPADADG